MTKKTDLAISTRIVERKILLLRGERVLLDRDLAALYQVKPIALRQAVKRNKGRFPPDFHFQLTEREAKVLLSQSVIPSRQSLGGHLPDAFTEQGVAMLPGSGAQCDRLRAAPGGFCRGPHQSWRAVRAST